jgi:hypothetical protein
MLEDFRAVLDTLGEMKGQLNILPNLLDPARGVDEWHLSPHLHALLRPHLVTLDVGVEDNTFLPRKVFMDSPMYEMLLSVGSGRRHA